MIRKTIQNSNGYALLLTLGLIILFTVLGMSLMTLTTSGTAKNSSRENDTQALNLAEKGMDFLVNEINTSLAIFTKEGKSRDDFIDELEKFDHNNIRYKCTFDSKGKLTNGIKVSTNSNQTNNSLACIKNVHSVSDENGLNELKKKLEIVSFGEVDGKNKQLTTFVEIGAENFPEQLKYTLTSKGDIHLNGATQIVGDLRIGGIMTTWDKAYGQISGTYYWMDSLKPSIKSVNSGKSPRIVFNKNNNYYSGTHLSSVYQLSKVENIESLFDLTVFEKKPTVIVSNNDIAEVNISSKKTNYYYEKSNSTINLASSKNSMNVPAGLYSGKRYLVYTKESCSWGNCSITYETSSNNNTFNFNESNKTYTIDRLSTNANLNISGNNIKVIINDSLYINGNLSISGNVEIQGSIFINGKLIIENSDIKTNALIYVNNNSSDSVSIEYSKINSLSYINEHNKLAKGTLVIFSNGNIKLSNNSLFDSTPSKFYGYLYSAKELEILGIGSKMEIHGGLYGKNIILHAIRGEASKSRISSSNKYGTYYFSNISTQSSDKTIFAKDEPENLNCSSNKGNTKICYNYDSRLHVLYNADIIETYLELNKKEVLIYKVDNPLIRSRE